MTYPTKTCEYCGNVGEGFFTWMNGETTCQDCLKSLPTDSRVARHEIVKLRKDLAGRASAVPQLPKGFSRTDLEDVLEGLRTLPQTVNVGVTMIEGLDTYVESTEGYLVKLLECLLAAAPLPPEGEKNV